MFLNGFYEFGFERKFYNIANKSEIKQHKLELYKGYYFTLDLYESGLKLMADVSNRIVRMDNFWSYIKQCFPKDNIDKKDLDRFFSKPITTMANYGNNKKFRIIGYDLSLSPKSKFPDKKY